MSEAGDKKEPKYEYLDHTADIQLHSWGASFEEAIGNCVVAMYGYMTSDIDTVESVYSMDFRAEGSDLCVLVYNLLDACLFRFSTEPFFIGNRCEVISLKHEKSKADTSRQGAEDEEGVKDAELESENLNYVIHLRAYGDSFDTQKHPPGTEVKAITYSNLQVFAPNELKSIDSPEDRNNVYQRHDNEYNIFVILDI